MNFPPYDGRSFWARAWERAETVLLRDPPGLTEFATALVAIVMGLQVNEVHFAGGRTVDYVGGVVLALLAVPQIVGAIHGGERLRHLTNGLAVFAALAQLNRYVGTELPVERTLFCLVALFSGSLLFRSEVVRARRLRRAREQHA